MTPLRKATVVATKDGQITLAFDGGWTCAVGIVSDGVGRVLFTPPEGLREPRTWAIAPIVFPFPWGGGVRGAGRGHSSELGQAANTLFPTSSPGERGQIRATLFAASVGVVTSTDSSLAISNAKLRAKPKSGCRRALRRRRAWASASRLRRFRSRHKSKLRCWD